METTDDPRQALAGVERFLSAHPVENNVVLSLLHQRLDHPEPGRYWTVRRGTDVAGFAMQSPPTVHALLTTMPLDATQALAAFMAAEEGPAVPGVLAEAATAAAFAGIWSELLPGCVATPEEGQRIYHLAQLIPAPPTPGRFRRAEPHDRDLLIRWWRAFGDETGAHSGEPATAVDRELNAGRLFVWEHAGPVCMARATAGVAGVSRVGFVYTPTRHRRHGYAAAFVSALSAWLAHAEGLDCMLYTQLANASSNEIYRRLGYCAVAEILAYRFHPATASP